MSNWSNLIPPHLWTPQLGSYEGGVNNWIQYSLDDDVISVPTSLPSHPLTVSRFLRAAIDDKDIIESLNRANTTSSQLLLQRQAMNEREQNKQGYHTMVTKTSGSNCSPLYRGVTKVNEDRYEAFVWDNTISEGRGRTVYIGGYLTELEAARAHDLVSIKLYGQNTVTNFPASCYGHEFSEMQKLSKIEFILAMRRRGKGFTGRDCSYRGVYRIPEARRWEAWLGQDNGFLPKIFLGRHYSAEDAARAYDIALIKFKGVDAITNFDLSTYEVKRILQATKPPTVQIVPTMSELILQPGSSESSYSNHFLRQKLLTQRLSNQSSPFDDYNNFNLIRSHPYTSGIRNSLNSVGNNSATFANMGKNVEQPLIQQLSNSPSSYQGYQNQNLIQSYPYSIGGLNGTGSGVRLGSTNNNSVGNDAMCQNKGQNITEQPSTQQLINSSSSFHGNYSFGGLSGIGFGLGTNDNSVSNYGAMFPNQGTNVEQSQLLGIGQDFQAPEAQQNQFNVNLINNQSLPQSPSLTLVHHGNQNLGLQNPQVEPTNQEFEAAQQVPLNYSPNNLNQNPNQNSFFNNFLNLCSETNTGSLSQIIEGVDDSDLSEILNNSGDSFLNPSSETNTGSQSLMTTGPYIREGETDWFGDLDKFLEEMDVDNVAFN